MPEIQVPDKIDPQSPGDYLEIMSKVVFQSGMPYKIVESKCPGRKEAFHDFDAAKVAGMTPSEIDSLTQDTRVIRNRRKLEAMISNSQKVLELEAQYGGFQRYLRTHADFPSLVKDMRKQFKFLGDMGCITTCTLSARKCPTIRNTRPASKIDSHPRPVRDIHHETRRQDSAGHRHQPQHHGRDRRGPGR